MKKIYSTLLVLMLMLITNCSQIFAQQLPNPGFEDWSGEKFDGNIQPKDWYASNISQSAIGMTFNFNLAHQEAGHSGEYSLMVQDTEVGAAGIVEVSPGYFSFRQALVIYRRFEHWFCHRRYIRWHQLHSPS